MVRQRRPPLFRNTTPPAPPKTRPPNHRLGAPNRMGNEEEVFEKRWSRGGRQLVSCDAPV